MKLPVRILMSAWPLFAVVTLAMVAISHRHIISLDASPPMVQKNWIVHSVDGLVWIETYRRMSTKFDLRIEFQERDTERIAHLKMLEPSIILWRWFFFFAMIASVYWFFVILKNVRRKPISTAAISS